MADPKERPVSASDLAGLRSYLPLAVGATISHLDPFPTEFRSIGINPRDPATNTYIGMTVSWPTPDLGVYGLTWDDLAEGRDNEDFVTVDLTKSVATTWPATMFESAYPQYANLHKAEKPHLRAKPKSSP